MFIFRLYLRAFFILSIFMSLMISSCDQLKNNKNDKNNSDKISHNYENDNNLMDKDNIVYENDLKKIPCNLYKEKKLYAFFDVEEDGENVRYLYDKFHKPKYCYSHFVLDNYYQVSEKDNFFPLKFLIFWDENKLENGLKQKNRYKAFFSPKLFFKYRNYTLFIFDSDYKNIGKIENMKMSFLYNYFSIQEMSDGLFKFSLYNGSMLFFVQEFRVNHFKKNEFKHFN